MSDGHEGSRRRRNHGNDPVLHDDPSRFVFGLFWGLLFVTTFLVAGPWAGFHGVLLGCVGLLVLLRPPAVALPRHWWILAAVFMIAGCAAFLPAGWFVMPGWRHQLENLGIETGPQVVIQSRQAVETLGLFATILFTGLWLAGHRPSPSQLRIWALAFTLGVAAYAVFSRILQNQAIAAQGGGDALFGFFPNRNHTATYLAMGCICGLGNVLQALRDKKLPTLAIALAATAICLWAVTAWSLSRAGVVLLAIGCLAWFPMLGRHYLGKHGLWAIGLIALTVTGLFFIADSEVKQRLTTTVEKAGAVVGKEKPPLPGQEKPALEAGQDLDFRIPTALDTLALIRDFEWTGIGAGQFYYVFPQYRNLSAIVNDSDHRHPESDWLWLAAETGVPAALTLLVLVLLAARKSLVAILAGRDRALRSACLVAAMLVAIHGIFDVPGHRITLAWSAALLFALSLRSPTHGPLPAPPRSWPFRLAAVLMLICAMFLIRAQWWGGPQPALTASQAARDQAMDLYRRDLALRKAALAKGETYQPEPSQDLLELALTQLDSVSRKAPLDRELLRLHSSLALQFDDKFDLVEKNFTLERALDPAWIDAPLRQAEALADFRPATSAALWRDALLRAERLDRLKPGSSAARVRVKQQISQQATGKPELQKWVPNAESEGPATQ